MNPFTENDEIADYKVDNIIKLIEKLVKKSNETKLKALIELKNGEVPINCLSLLIRNIIPLLSESEYLISKYSREILSNQIKWLPKHLIKILSDESFDWINFIIDNGILKIEVVQEIIRRTSAIKSLKIFYYLLTVFANNPINNNFIFDYSGNFKSYPLLYKVLFFCKSNRLALKNFEDVISTFESNAFEYLKSVSGRDHWPRHFILIDIYDFIEKDIFIKEIEFIEEKYLRKILERIEALNIKLYFESCLNLNESKSFIIFDFLKEENEKLNFLYKNIEHCIPLIKKVFTFKNNRRLILKEILMQMGDNAYNKGIKKYLIASNELSSKDLSDILACGSLFEENLVQIVFHLKNILSQLEIDKLLAHVNVYKHWILVSQILSENLILSKLFNNNKLKLEAKNLDFTEFFIRFIYYALDSNFNGVKYNLPKIIVNCSNPEIIREILDQVDVSYISKVILDVSTYFEDFKDYSMHKTLFMYYDISYINENIRINYDVVALLPPNKEIYKHFLNNDYDTFITYIESFIDSIDILHKFNAFYVGYNLDTTAYDYHYQIPCFNNKCSTLYEVLLEQKNLLNSKGIMLLSILAFLNYEESKIDNYLQLLKKEEEIPLVNLTKNAFLYERIKNMAFETSVVSKVDLISMKFENLYKHLDILIRNDVIKCSGVIDPTFLSFEALNKIIGSIIEGQQGYSITIEYSGEVEALKLLKSYSSPFDALEMMENDANLLLRFLRSKRLKIYERLIKSSTSFCIETMVAAYNYSKLENFTIENAIFNFVIDIFKNLKRNYFYALSYMVDKMDNVHLALFLERMLIIHCMEDKLFESKLIEFCYNSLVLSDNSNEIKTFARAFPGFYRNLIKEKYQNFKFIENIIDDDFISDLTGKHYEYKFSLVRFNSFSSYTLRYSYINDSLKSQLEFFIPFDYRKPGFIRNIKDKKNKADKSLLKLNELTMRTVKYHEIFLIWKSNIDNKLAGYSECLICYFIIEPKHQSYPDFSCSNCTIKFHTSCLFKWLKTSKTSLCPMCRSEMNLSN